MSLRFAAGGKGERGFGRGCEMAAATYTSADNSAWKSLGDVATDEGGGRENAAG